MKTEQAFQQFLHTKLAESSSNSTIAWYRSNFNTIGPHLPTNLEDIQTHHVIAFLASERERGMTQGTLANRYRSLTAFFNWCEMDVMNPIKRIKPPKKLPRCADYEDVLILIERTPNWNWLGVRDRAVVSLMLDTGMRAGEVSRAMLEDIDIGQQLITIPDTKTNDPRIAPFSDATGKRILQYLMNRPATDLPYLFISRSKQRKGEKRGYLTTAGLYQMFVSRSQQAGVSFINPHSLRHLFATKALNDGLRLEIVSKILGHASVDFTLKTYTALMNETIRREYAEHWT